MFQGGKGTNTTPRTQVHDECMCSSAHDLVGSPIAKGLQAHYWQGGIRAQSLGGEVLSVTSMHINKTAS